MKYPKKIELRSSLKFSLLTFIAFLSFSFHLPEEKNTNSRFDLSQITMCASYDVNLMNQVPFDGPLAPRFDSDWQHNFPVTTDSQEAQSFFNQGMFFTYAFNHAEAERAFKEAARLDPNCAMAYWGIALSLGPNINRPMLEKVMDEAFENSQKALELSKRTTPLETALIEALSKRYQKNPPQNRSRLDAVYAAEMRIVAHRFRENVDVLTLFAEALMDTMPWDYWQADGSPKPATREMHATLDYVLEQMPEHPGANHYYIHSVEAISPESAEKCADKLTQIQYKSGHLVHMPSHIYIRLGRYEDSNVANSKAIVLDEEYINICKGQGYYPASYYPHNIHFLWFGAAMTGQKALALEAANKTTDKSKRQRFGILPLYTYLRFGLWEEILNTKEPDPSQIYLHTIWQFATGMAYSKTAQPAKAKAALKVLKKRLKHKQLQKMDNPFWPVAGMTQLSYLILSGEIAAQNGNYAQQAALLEQAVNVQDQFTYMEPPFYYMQLRQYLGNAQLKAGNPKAAEATFKKELSIFPNNGWSLFGLHQSLKQQNKTTEAQTIFQQFEKAWAKADVELDGAVF